MYNHTKELARKHDQQQQSDSKDGSEELGEVATEKQNIDDTEETSTDSEQSQKSGGEGDDDDECASFIRGLISTRPSTEAIKDENHIFSPKTRAKRKPRNKGNKILPTRGKWIKFLGLNDAKLTRHGKFLTTDQLANQFSGGRVTTRGAAKKRKSEEEEEGEVEEEEEPPALPERKRSRRGKKKTKEEEGQEERKEEKKNEEERGIMEEEEAKEQSTEEYKRRHHSMDEKSHDRKKESPAVTPAVTVEEARKKIHEAQEKEDQSIDHLPIGSLVSRKISC